VSQIAPEALERLHRYSWPGNIRELQSVLKQALLQANGKVLLPNFLPEFLGGQGESIESSPSETGSDGMETFVVRQRLAYDVRDLYLETHRQVDRVLLARVLDCTHGNLQQAALVLGIARQTLRQKIRELGLSVPRPDNADRCPPV
jgi:two-component system nitrogen regulation response regulator GlnG